MFKELFKEPEFLLIGFVNGLTLGLLLLLASCGDSGCKDGKVGNRTTICKLHIVEVQPEEIKDFCGSGTACWNENLNRIVIREVGYINNYEVETDLGHEVAHAMGYEHK